MTKIVSLSHHINNQFLIVFNHLIDFVNCNSDKVCVIFLVCDQSYYLMLNISGDKHSVVTTVVMCYSV